MNSAEERHYLIIWLWLVVLVAISVGAASVLPKVQALALVFSIAIVKAVLVARHYMHLKNEKPIYYAMALVPLAFIILFLFGLFPDFVYHVTKP